MRRKPIARQPSYPGRQRAVTAPPVPDNQVDTSANAIRGPPRLWDRDTVCAFFGGIDVSTLYRGMDAGRYPRPVLVSANIARWIADEVEAALDAMIADRDNPRNRKRIERRARGYYKDKPAERGAVGKVAAKTDPETEHV